MSYWSAIMSSLRRAVESGNDDRLFQHSIDVLKQHLTDAPQFKSATNDFFRTLRKAEKQRKKGLLKFLEKYPTHPACDVAAGTIEDIDTRLTMLKMVKKALKAIKIPALVGLLGWAGFKLFSQPDADGSHHPQKRSSLN